MANTNTNLVSICDIEELKDITLGDSFIEMGSDTWEFISGPGQNILAKDELVTKIIIEQMQANEVWAYKKVGLRNALAISVLGAAVRGILQDEVFSNLQIAMGSVAPTIAGARVGLAVDGSASNDSSNMWAEVRIAYLLQKLALGAEGLTAEDVLKMATVGGAQILGRNDIGSLEVGRAADMILIDFQQLLVGIWFIMSFSSIPGVLYCNSIEVVFDSGLSR